MEENSEVKPKKKRGNPNFKTGQKRPYPAKNKLDDKPNQPMTDTKETEAADKTAKTDIPNDLFSDKIPENVQLPLDGEVITKEYAQIADPNDGKKEGATGPEATGSGDGNTAATETALANNAPTPQEIQTGAEQCVMLMLKGYEKLHGFGRYLGKMDEKMLAAKHAQGKINLNMLLPLGKKDIMLREFFADYNSSIDENISVSEKFKEEVTPPLTRIAIKRGWTVSDELSVGLLVAEDLGTKVSMLIGLKKSANLILEACEKIMKGQDKKEEPPADKEEEKKGETPDPAEATMQEADANEWRESETT